MLAQPIGEKGKVRGDIHSPQLSNQVTSRLPIAVSDAANHNRASIDSPHISRLDRDLVLSKGKIGRAAIESRWGRHDSPQSSKLEARFKVFRRLGKGADCTDGTHHSQDLRKYLVSIGLFLLNVRHPETSLTGALGVRPLPRCGTERGANCPLRNDPSTAQVLRKSLHFDIVREDSAQKDVCPTLH